jgi:hypothetical protein
LLLPDNDIVNGKQGSVDLSRKEGECLGHFHSPSALGLWSLLTRDWRKSLEVLDIRLLKLIT